MMKPEIITFTGVDTRTDINACIELADTYPVEFGFLYSETRQEPRYSGCHILSDFAAKGLRTALHLCGIAARDTMKTQSYPPVCKDAGRVQVNLKTTEYRWGALHALGALKPTIQQSRDTQDWPLTPLDVAPLLDCSGGRGTEIQSYPANAPMQPVGYAGGFRPGNVRPFLESLHAHPHGFWIDMETGVRTDEWFDITKCRAVCEEVFDV